MIYADYNGSAPLLPAVREHLMARLQSDLFANPNAIHCMGSRLAAGIEKCRGIVAEVLGCYPDQVCFNSGASEGVTTILNSVLEAASGERRLVLTSPIEHSVVNSCLEAYQQKGFVIEELAVSRDGVVDLGDLEARLRDSAGRIALVAVMAANNETGALQPYSEIAEITQRSGVEYFSDTTQLIGKGQFNFHQANLDYAVCSGHKIGALPGSGFILFKEATKLRPLVFGGGQERSLRGGTQNYLGIESMAVALQDFQQKQQRLAALARARQDFEEEMQRHFPSLRIIAENAPRLAGTTLLGYPGIHGQAVQIELESQDIFVTTSAACSDNEPETSRVLRAMGVPDELGRSVIRISLCHHQGPTEYSALARALNRAYNKLSKIKSF